MVKSEPARILREDQPAASLKDAEVSAPKTVEQLIRRAESAAASDIHLQLDSNRAVVSFRIDGLMTSANKFSADIAKRVFGRAPKKVQRISPARLSDS